MNKILSYANNNKVHLSLTAIATLNAYLINYFNTLCNCSVSFVLFLFTVNLIQNYFGTTKAIYSAVTALSVAYTAQAGLPYHVQGQFMPELIKFSLSSAAISVAVSLRLISYFSTHYPKNSFMVKNCTCVILAVLIDASIMAIYFASMYKPAIATKIFIKSLGYKAIYTVLLFATSPILKTVEQKYIDRLSRFKVK